MYTKKDWEKIKFEVQNSIDTEKEMFQGPFQLESSLADMEQIAMWERLQKEEDTKERLNAFFAKNIEVAHEQIIREIFGIGVPALSRTVIAEKHGIKPYIITQMLSKFKNYLHNETVFKKFVVCYGVDEETAENLYNKLKDSWKKEPAKKLSNVRRFTFDENMNPDYEERLQANIKEKASFRLEKPKPIIEKPIIKTSKRNHVEEDDEELNPSGLWIPAKLLPYHEIVLNLLPCGINSHTTQSFLRTILKEDDVKLLNFCFRDGHEANSMKKMLFEIRGVMPQTIRDLKRIIVHLNSPEINPYVVKYNEEVERMLTLFPKQNVKKNRK